MRSRSATAAARGLAVSEVEALLYRLARRVTRREWHERRRRKAIRAPVARVTASDAALEDAGIRAIVAAEIDATDPATAGLLWRVLWEESSLRSAADTLDIPRHCARRIVRDARRRLARRLGDWRPGS
jgi:DNA-directed RNA polymerase specialized sigma24 family protein